MMLRQSKERVFSSRIHGRVGLVNPHWLIHYSSSFDKH